MLRAFARVFKTYVDSTHISRHSRFNRATAYWATNVNIMATGGAEVGGQDVIEGPSRALDNDRDETFTFFFGSKSPFSQWHPSEFEVEGVTYNCAEQFMMHRKAGNGLGCIIVRLGSCSLTAGA